jgi:hypothetical protein
MPPTVREVKDQVVDRPPKRIKALHFGILYAVPSTEPHNPF